MRHHDTNGNGDVLGLLSANASANTTTTPAPRDLADWCDDVIVALGPAWSRGSPSTTTTTPRSPARRSR